MKVFAKPDVALGFAAFFFCALICTHVDDVTAAPLDLGGDLLAGVVLLVGGVLSGRDWGQGRQYQLVGWSFMVSLLFHSVLGNLSDILMNATEGARSGQVILSPVVYTALEALLLAVSTVGLWTTLTTVKSPAVS